MWSIFRLASERRQRVHASSRRDRLVNGQRRRRACVAVAGEIMPLGREVQTSRDDSAESSHAKPMDNLALCCYMRTAGRSSHIDQKPSDRFH